MFKHLIYFIKFKKIGDAYIFDHILHEDHALRFFHSFFGFHNLLDFLSNFFSNICINYLQGGLRSAQNFYRRLLRISHAIVLWVTVFSDRFFINFTRVRNSSYHEVRNGSFYFLLAKVLLMKFLQIIWHYWDLNVPFENKEVIYFIIVEVILQLLKTNIQFSIAFFYQSSKRLWPIAIFQLLVLF